MPVATPTSLHTLVIGGGQEGLSDSRNVWLSGPDPGSLPWTFLGRDLYWWIWPTIRHASMDSRFGRRIWEKAMWSGDPLIGMDKSVLRRDSIQRVGRTVSSEDGLPQTEDGEVPDVANVDHLSDR